MGCPPDPIEVSLWRGNDNSKALEEKAKLLIPQAKKATKFLVELCKRFTSAVPADLAKNAQTLNKDASHYTTADLGKTFNWEHFPTTYNNYPDMSVLYAHLSDSEKYVKKIEINLCITRDLLLKVVKLIGEKKLSEHELKEFLEEKNLHLLHRREDKEIKLKTLESDISTCHFIMTTKEYTYTPEEIQKYTEKLKQLEPELTRISALTDDDLLENRDLF